jgi:hypothetical protein
MSLLSQAEAQSRTASHIRHGFDRLSVHLAPIAERLPLVDRELTRAARDKRMFVFRLVAAIILAVVVSVRWLDNMPGDMAADELTMFIIALITLANIVIAMGAAPIMTAALIAEEKQERTLPLLLIADFRGFDIFLAKYLSVFLVCALLMISSAPLLAIAAILGGVEAGAIAVMILLSIALLAHSCAAGLWCSARASGGREAVLLTFVLLTCWHAGLIYFEVWWQSGLNPSPLQGLSDFVLTGFAPNEWVVAVGLHAFSALILALLTIRLLPSLTYDSVTGNRRRRRRIPSGVTRWWRGHPLVQLIDATTSGFTLSFDSWRLRIAAAIGLAVLAGITFGYGMIFVALVFCYDIAACMTSIRRSGALDDILATPMEQSRVARAFIRVFAARSLVYIPAACLALFFVAAELSGATFSWSSLAMLAALLPSQLLLLTTAGAYAGTRTNRAASQAALTVLLGGLTIVLAMGIAECVFWYTPSTIWQSGFSNQTRIRITVVLSTIFNCASGALCYIAFATQLREDLISNVRPRFQSFLDTFTE